VPVERKYERDIDLLVAEELAVNPRFAQWFKSRTKFAAVAATVEDLRVSKSNNNGETDLEIVYRDNNGNRFALLVEDKIDAPLQPDQAARYRLRAERDIAAGYYGDFEAVLCAPRHYINNRDDLDGFDQKITLEEIADAVEQEGSNRSLYRSEFLRTAGTRRKNAWSREDDPATNAFWDAAYELAAREFPILEMKRLRLTKGSSWITFRPRDLPTQPKRVYISFKGDRGQIDLTFGHTAMHLFEPLVSDLLGPGMSLHQTEASSAIRIETEGFRIADGIETGLPRLKAAFEASSRLLSFYRGHRQRLDDAARAATPLERVAPGKTPR
jgi:hypothetical protein